jgi:hypothetical protein
MTCHPSNEELAMWDAASRLVALIDRIRPRYKREGLGGLNDAERTLLALFELDNEVCNGGFGQWLYQTPRDLVAISPECLQRIGETQVHQVVRSVLSEIRPSALRSDWQKWQQYLDQMPMDFWDRIAVYDRACGPLERGLIERLWSYAQSVVAEVRA